MADIILWFPSFRSNRRKVLIASPLFIIRGFRDLEDAKVIIHDSLL